MIKGCTNSLTDVVTRRRGKSAMKEEITVELLSDKRDLPFPGTVILLKPFYRGPSVTNLWQIRLQTLIPLFLPSQSAPRSHLHRLDDKGRTEERRGKNEFLCQLNLAEATYTCVQNTYNRLIWSQS